MWIISGEIIFEVSSECTAGDDDFFFRVKTITILSGRISDI